MRQIFALFMFVLNAAAYGSEDAGEHQNILDQQRAIHTTACQPETDMLLQQWRFDIAGKEYAPKKLYIFWEDNKQETYWLRTFEAGLKRDLLGLGLIVTDRVANHMDKKPEFCDEAAINEAEKIMLFVTYGLSSNVVANRYSYKDMNAVGCRSDDSPHRLKKGSIPLKDKTILPLLVNGIYSWSYVSDSPRCFLDTMSFSEMNYLSFLIKLARFAYDLPEDLNFHTTALNYFMARVKKMNDLDK
jgi:hypothetical protein